MKKTVFITWTERRPGANYGKPVAALWAREANTRGVEKAREYAALSNTAGGDHRVYVTSPYELFAVAKREAIAAHTAAAIDYDGALDESDRRGQRPQDYQ